MIKNTNQKNETNYLWWMNSKNNTRLPAGVAFYEENYGEYRLKIDILQSSEENRGARIYLRAIGSVDDKILYRAEMIQNKNGKFSRRVIVGDGYSSNETDGEVYIDFGPYEKTLVMSLKSKN